MSSLKFYASSQASISRTAGTNWADVHDGAGTDIVDTSPADVYCNLIGTNYGISRNFLNFDTSAIPDSVTIDAVTLSIMGDSKSGTTAYTYNIYSSTAADIIVVGSYANAGTTAYSTAKARAGWLTSSMNDYAFNATGITATSKTGITKVCLREVTKDVANSAPTVDNNTHIGLKQVSDATIENRPYLKVDYTLSTAVQVDSGNNLTQRTGTTATNSITIGNNSNRILIVGNWGVNNASDNITGATYAGVSMTKLGTSWRAGLARQMSTWYLLEPTVGANDLVVSFSGSTTSLQCYLSLYNVLQQAPTEGTRVVDQAEPISLPFTTSVANEFNCGWTICGSITTAYVDATIYGVSNMVSYTYTYNDIFTAGTTVTPQLAGDFVSRTLSATPLSVVRYSAPAPSTSTRIPRGATGGVIGGSPSII